MTDIEELTILNSELSNAVNEVKKTYLLDESNINTSKKNE